MEEQTTTTRVALKYGVLLAVINMVFMTVVNIAGQSQNKMLSSVQFIFSIVALVIAMKEFREKNKGFMSFGEGLGLGTMLSAITGLLSSAFSTFYNQFIDPTILTQALDKVRMDMEQKGMDDAQIDQALEASKMFMSPGILFIMGIVMSILLGFILSLIISAILRRDKPVFE